MKIFHFFLAATLIFSVSCKDISKKLNTDEEDPDFLVEETENEEGNDLYADFETEETVATDENNARTDSLTDAGNETPSSTEEETLNLIKKNNKIKPGKFYIIAGSFKTYKNAEELYKKLSTQGYSNAQILDPVNEFSRVVVASFNDEGEARTELSKLRKKYNDNSIWLLPAEKN